MTARQRRVARLEAESIATLPLDPELEALLHRYAVRVGVPVDEVRTEARRIAWATRGMSRDAQLRWCAEEAGCTVAEFREDIEELIA